MLYDVQQVAEPTSVTPDSRLSSLILITVLCRRYCSPSTGEPFVIQEGEVFIQGHIAFFSGGISFPPFFNAQYGVWNVIGCLAASIESKGVWESSRRTATGGELAGEARGRFFKAVGNPVQGVI